jgi:hypothetical protein
MRTPDVLVPLDTWSVITRELSRVAPAEGVMLPLVALARNLDAPHPCITTTLRGLEAVVLNEVITVPPALQRNGMVNVAVLPGTDALLDAATTAACRARPALRVVAHLHSHPFARGHTWPSHTDIHGHMRPLLSKARAEGLDTTWSFIACRNRNDDGWVLQAFALDQGEVVDLGPARLVDPQHRLVREARLPNARLRGLAGLVRRWRKAASPLGLWVRVDPLLDGWTRLRVCREDVTVGVLLVDHANAQVCHVFVVRGSQVSAVELESPVMVLTWMQQQAAQAA